MRKPAPDDAAAHLAFRDRWRAECLEDESGRTYLALDAEGREDWIDYDSVFLDPKAYGTHPLDIQYTQGDLMRLVEEKTAQMEAPGSSR